MTKSSFEMLFGFFRLDQLLNVCNSEMGSRPILTQPVIIRLQMVWDGPKIIESRSFCYWTKYLDVAPDEMLEYQRWNQL